MTSITLDKTTLSLVAGDEATLIATVKPDNATDKTVTWTSSDPSVATVADGKVHAVKLGIAVITAKAGDKTATCTVTVAAKVIPVTSIWLDKSEMELTRAREEVASRMEQSRQLLQMLQRTQFEENAHDVIQQIQEASEGRHIMTPDDWKKFHSAVNLLYPDLNDKIVEHLGERITEQQLRICHLMRIGMTNPQIERLTDIPKVTVWRWVKKYEWVLE